ncbi:ABC transporter [Streptomyces paludis]|uniref:ABC transporter n=1 Tax=Streptomyces paludis TaxID=2282738 RepID=A0A345I1Z6_9ACTN|nr:ABC transporter [Streptomyces paludis]AXG82970.1 ABC transporter [Streptomyces paludis]
MTALVRYQTALLLRSQRWLPPFLLYGIFLIVGVQAGQPVLDSLGYAAAALLPVTVWLVRISVRQEPAASRAVAAAVTGARRVHLAALLAAVAVAAATGLAGTLVVTLVSKHSSGDRTVDVPVLPAGVAGLLAAAVCLLVGVAAGALCSRPVLRGRGWSIAAGVLASLAALVAPGSPAKYAIVGLVSGSRSGAIHTPLLPLAAAALVAAVAAAVACALVTVRE